MSKLSMQLAMVFTLDMLGNPIFLIRLRLSPEKSVDSPSPKQSLLLFRLADYKYLQKSSRGIYPRRCVECWVI